MLIPGLGVARMNLWTASETGAILSVVGLGKKVFDAYDKVDF